MKRIVIAGLVGWLAQGALATVVNFTAAEGYAAGDLGNHVDWSGGGSDFQVDPSGSGSLGNIGATGGQVVTGVGPGLIGSSSQTSYTLSTVFTLNGTTATASGAANQNIFSLEFVDTYASRDISLKLMRRSDAQSGYFSINFFESSNGTQVNAFGAAIPGLWFGLGTTPGISDLLEMTFTVTRGVDKDNWSYEANWGNLANGADYGTLSGTFGSDDNFFNNDVSMKIESYDASAANLGPVTISSLEVSSIPEPATIGLFALSGVGVMILRRLRL